MRLKISPKIIIRKLYLIILIGGFLTASWTGVYIYLRVYKAITQTDAVTIIRSDLALQGVQTKTFERIRARREKIRALRPLNIPGGLNPFLEKTE